MQQKNKELNFLKHSFEIFENNFISVLILILIFYIPYFLIFFIFGNSIISYFPETHNFNGIELLTSDLIIVIFSTLLNTIFSPLLMASMYLLVSDYIVNKTINLKAILLKVFKLFPLFLLTNIIYNLMIFSSLFVLVITPYIVTMFYFHTFIICEDEKNPIKALKSSYLSLKGNFLITFGVILLTSLLNSFLSNILFNIVQLTNMPNNLFFSIFFNLISTIISAYFYIFLSIWYRNRLDIIEFKEGNNEYFKGKQRISK